MAIRILHVTTELPPHFDGGLGTAVAGLVQVSTHAGLTPAVLLLDPHSHGAYEGSPYSYPGLGLIPYGHPYAHSEYSARSNNPRTFGYGSNASDPGAYGVAWLASQQLSLADQEGGALMRAGLMRAPQSEDIGALIGRARDWRPDIIHLHSVELWSVADAIRQESGAPLVYTVHSLQLAEYEIGGALGGLELWPIQQKAIAAATHVIALSESERLLLAQAWPNACTKIRVAGNGIDESPTTETVERRVAGEARVVLYVGRFAERKGVNELLQAIPAVLAALHKHNIQFVLIGGYRHATGAAMAADWLPPALHDLRSRVHFTGWLAPHEVAKWYQIADILVVPSWYEPFGMVVLEGMLHALPIAATNVGGPSEILAHERTGLLFEPRDVEALANAILWLVKDPALRQRLGIAAAAEVRRRWLWPKVIEQIRAVYQEAIAVQELRHERV